MRHKKVRRRMTPSKQRVPLAESVDHAEERLLVVGVAEHGHGPGPGPGHDRVVDDRAQERGE
eukprot:m.115063 g.115063  ORF g.115063 m.115063 type:complete len:62 (-) comp13552_c0_seq4:322-507(-)